MKYLCLSLVMLIPVVAMASGPEKKPIRLFNCEVNIGSFPIDPLYFTISSRQDDRFPTITYYSFRLRGHVEEAPFEIKDVRTEIPARYFPRNHGRPGPEVPYYESLELVPSGTSLGDIGLTLYLDTASKLPIASDGFTGSAVLKNNKSQEWRAAYACLPDADSLWPGTVR